MVTWRSACATTMPMLLPWWKVHTAAAKEPVYNAAMLKSLQVFLTGDPGLLKSTPRCNLGFYISGPDRQEVERLLSGSGLRFRFRFFFFFFFFLMFWLLYLDIEKKKKEKYFKTTQTQTKKKQNKNKNKTSKKQKGKIK